MFFVLSKTLGVLMLPSGVIAMAVAVGGLLSLAGRAPKLSRRLLQAGIGALFVCGLSPLGNILLLPLEERFPRPALPSSVAGIIILGGFESPGISRARGQLSLNESAERLTEAVVLARRLPGARVIFTGGDGTLTAHEGSAADLVGAYLTAVGIDPGRQVLEATSRTTYENAVNVRAMLEPKPGEQWLLVTSAFHMPRAVGTFRQQGFEVIAWPVDYRTRGTGDVLAVFDSLESGLERVDFTWREWLGLIAYRLSGRTGAIWPGPR